MKSQQKKSAIIRFFEGCAGVVLAALLCAVSCKKADVLPSSVSVTPSSATVTEGETANFSATVFPADAVYSGITWSSSDTKVATVSNGVVTGVKAGSATITATADGVSGTATVTVNAKVFPVQSVSLDKTELELTEGDETQLTATVAPDNATDKSVSWKSSDEKIATVSSDGKITAIAPGEATITVTTTDGNKTATCTVTVKAKTISVTGITLDKTELELTEGDEVQLKATVAPDDATDKSITWKSSDDKVATVSSDGKVTAVAPGEATITVTTTDGNKTATCKVTVNAKIYPVESVSLDKSEIELTEGDEEQLTATIAPENATNQNVSWSSSDEEVAAVTFEGKVTAVKAGTATITVTTEDGGKTATCAVTVNAKLYPVESVSLNKSSLTLAEGDNAQLTATIKPENASNKNVSWKSSNAGVAKVTSDGKVTAVKAGTTTITVTTEDGGKTATCSVTVKAKAIPVTGVSLDKSSLTLAEGDNAQLTATVKPDNATNKNVSWKSSNTSVATVSSGGKVTAVKAGTATITVTTQDGSKTATCAVTVKSGLPEGALAGVFSVSSTKKVHFSKGNLVATINASGAPTAWKFAANQYDYLGEGGANQTIGTAAGDVDLFGWSTEATKYGISTSTTDSDYSGDFVDWGKNIGDGSTWRTLSKDEWVYLFETRTNASSLYECGVTVCGKTNCVVIAPDGFTGTIETSYDATAWATAEAAGLVCLPTAGYRDGSRVNGVSGLNWSSTALDESSAYNVGFLSFIVNPANRGSRRYGYSVRLITDVK